MSYRMAFMAYERGTIVRRGEWLEVKRDRLPRCEIRVNVSRRGKVSAKLNGRRMEVAGIDAIPSGPCKTLVSLSSNRGRIAQCNVWLDPVGLAFEIEKIELFYREAK